MDTNSNMEFKKYSHRIITLQLYDEENSLKRAYTYPAEDFCLFKDYPHSRMIAPVIALAQQIQCSCSLVWIHKY